MNVAYWRRWLTGEHKIYLELVGENGCAQVDLSLQHAGEAIDLMLCWAAKMPCARHISGSVAEIRSKDA